MVKFALGDLKLKIPGSGMNRRLTNMDPWLEHSTQKHIRCSENSVELSLSLSLRSSSLSSSSSSLSLWLSLSRSWSRCRCRCHSRCLRRCRGRGLVAVLVVLVVVIAVVVAVVVVSVVLVVVAMVSFKHQQQSGAVPRSFLGAIACVILRACGAQQHEITANVESTQPNAVEHILIAQQPQRSSNNKPKL